VDRAPLPPGARGGPWGGPGHALARRSGLSERTVLRWTLARSRGSRPRKLGRAMGLDADARRQGHHDHTWTVDLAQGQPMATWKGRRADEVMAGCKSRPHDAREKVEVVVLERSKTSFAAVKEVLGDHGPGIDRFHGVHQAVGALDAVMRSGHKQRDPEDAQERRKLRKRWLQSAAQRNVDAWSARDEWRRCFPP